jgi:hypothetical protein
LYSCHSLPRQCRAVTADVCDCSQPRRCGVRAIQPRERPHEELIDVAADAFGAYAAVADGCMTLSWKTVSRKRKPSSIGWTKLSSLNGGRIGFASEKIR